MTLGDRVNAFYEMATAKGLVVKTEDGKTKPFTQALAKEFVEAEDARNEETLLAKDVVKTSYGSIKVIHRNARKARNPKTQEEVDVPAYDTLKIVVNKAFNEKLNPVK